MFIVRNLDSRLGSLVDLVCENREEAEFKSSAMMEILWANNRSLQRNWGSSELLDAINKAVTIELW